MGIKRKLTLKQENLKPEETALREGKMLFSMLHHHQWIRNPSHPF
jgi:hypothetical protein